MHDITLSAPAVVFFAALLVAAITLSVITYAEIRYLRREFDEDLYVERDCESDVTPAAITLAMRRKGRRS